MIELSIQQDLKNETSNSITPTNSTKSKIGTPGGYYYNKSKKKSGLSTGGIIAIIIPCIIVLLGALALAYMLNRNQNPPLINSNKVGISSSTNINEKNII